MTTTLLPDEWLKFVDREYLDDFIKDGGASVKFVVPFDEGAHSGLIEGLTECATNRSYVVARIDAAETRVHMMDQVLFRVAEQVPWERLARSVLERLTVKRGYALPSDPSAEFLPGLAVANDLAESFLRLELERRLVEEVFRRNKLAKDFRVAMTQLCLAQLGGGPDGETTTRVILDWLTGRSKLVGAVKPYGIFTRIHRTNARFMFESMLDWLRFAGLPGLVVVVDLARVTLTKNPRDGSVYYTKASRLDAYELLRQFIDATDRANGFFFVVAPSVEFLDETDRGHGIGEYQALKFRVYDEVRDVSLVNPMATLIRVSTAPEQAVVE